MLNPGMALSICWANARSAQPAGAITHACHPERSEGSRGLARHARRLAAWQSDPSGRPERSEGSHAPTRLLCYSHVRHSREGGNPARSASNLDPRLRGDDKGMALFPRHSRESGNPDSYMPTHKTPQSSPPHNPSAHPSTPDKSESTTPTARPLRKQENPLPYIPSP